MTDSPGNQAKKNKRILPKKWLQGVSDSLNSCADLLIKAHISPNTLTVFALLSGLAAGILFFFNQPLWATMAIIICGVFDVLDGKVAVKTNKTSLFGAIFDSTLDRYSEFFIYLGIAFHLRNHWALWLIFFTFLGSSMVSYTRARAEGLGFECKVGIMQRAERLVLIAIGSFIGAFFSVFDTAIIIVMGIIAVVSNFTALQRTFYVKKAEQEKKQK